MKKIVLLVALCLCVGNLFAQDADKLRDEGDAALKAKDYATVVTKYGEYLKQNNYPVSYTHLTLPTNSRV